MKVGVAGVGYVGSTVAAGMAEMGYDVNVFDIDEELIKSIQAKDPDVPEGKEHFRSKRVKAALSPDVLLDCEIVFLCLPTPEKDGELDTDTIQAFVESVDFSEQTLVVKSTVPPGTCQMIDDKTPDSVVVGHNPEFLRQGRGLHDFMEGEKFIFGGSQSFHDVMDQLYTRHPRWSVATVAHVDWETAEMCKLANNAFLASKISLANEIGMISEAVNADGRAVMEIVSQDSRIDRSFTRPGPPWGGDCLPKDVQGLRHLASENGVASNMISATEYQNQAVVELTASYVDVIDNEKIGLLGLAFKPKGQSTTQSFARSLIPLLDDYQLHAADRSPAAVKEMKDDFPDILYDNAQAVVDESETVIMTTGHPEWQALNYGSTSVVDPVGVLDETEDYYDLFR